MGIPTLRSLEPREVHYAQTIFTGAGIDFNRVKLAPFAGAGNRPFTAPGSIVAKALLAGSALFPFLLPVGAIAAGVFAIAEGGSYILFLGPDGFNDALYSWGGRPRGATFIHELTHVWQGDTGAFQWEYIVDSLLSQAGCGYCAYEFRVGKDWREYHAEQQARIIEYCSLPYGNNTAYDYSGTFSHPLGPVLIPYLIWNVRRRWPTMPTLDFWAHGGWRWCYLCQELFYAGLGSGVCPVRGKAGHDRGRSGNYKVVVNVRGCAEMQSGWWRCSRCEGLFFSGIGAGVCPAGGGHAPWANSNYWLLITTQPDSVVFGDATYGQANWRWCRKCQVLFFGGYGIKGGSCPAGGVHDGSTSWNYGLVNP